MSSKYKPVEIEGGGAAAEDAAAAAGSPRAAHAAFILCSASTLVPWMAYISSLDYFMMLLPGMGIQYVVPCVYANAYCATPLPTVGPAHVPPSPPCAPVIFRWRYPRAHRKLGCLNTTAHGAFAS